VLAPDLQLQALGWDNGGMRTVNVDSIGEYIRQQREQAKISLRQLAQSAGVSNPYLSQIERGLRRPSAEILQQIAKGLRRALRRAHRPGPVRAAEADSAGDL
jgi:transcriptional regulator with XRE-family HTH domain